MATSTYKWKINSSEYAYIVSESNSNPFIYDTVNHKRIYLNDEVATVPDDAAINANVPVVESVYASAYNNMLTLLLDKGRMVSLPDYREFYNTDNSACIVAGTNTVCPRIIFESVVTLPAGSSAYSRVLRTETLPSGEYVIYYELGIPEGKQGAPGEQGPRGEAGATGIAGAQGAKGDKGDKGDTGKSGADAVSRYVSFIFARSNDIAYMQNKAKAVLDAAQTQNCYAKPMWNLPSLWHDSIPADDGSGNTSAIIWMSKKTFISDNTWSDYKWSLPEMVSDNDYIDYEWNTNADWATLEEAMEHAPAKTSPDDTAVDPNGWQDSPVDGAVWMAVRDVSNGEYAAGSEWTISKIKGEDGDPGTALNVKESEAGSYFESNTGAENEARLCTETSGNFTKGHLYVYAGGRGWVDMGEVQIEGASAYVHIKYANSASYLNSDAYQLPGQNKWIVFTGNFGEDHGEYMGIYADNTESDSSAYTDYKWSYVEGKDGFGYEYIFCATNTASKPARPTSGTRYKIGGGSVIDEEWSTSSDVYQSNLDFIPQDAVTVASGTEPQGYSATLWTDDAPEPTEQRPYVFESRRKRNQDGTWTAFSEPKIRNILSTAPPFVSRIFKRSDDLYSSDTAYSAECATLAEISTFADGGSYLNPVPASGYGWSDGIPDGNGVLWFSERKFVLDEEELHTSNPWSEPKIAEDNSNYDYEWYTGITSTAPQAPVKTHPAQSISAQQNNGWYDNPQPNSTWMAVRKVKGSVYENNSQWAISKIVGENGADGIVYKVVPSVNSVLYDANTQTFSVDAISCTTYPQALDASIKIYYSIDTVYNESDSSGMTEYQSPLVVPTDYDSSTELIAFYLFSGATMLDRITVPFVHEGSAGAIVRRSVWREGVTYYDGKTPDYSGNGEYYLDIVAPKNMVTTADTDFRFYKCKVTHVSSLPDNHYRNTDLWELVDDPQIFTAPIVLASKISADMIESRAITAEKLYAKKDGNVVEIADDRIELYNRTIDDSGNTEDTAHVTMRGTLLTDVDAAETSTLNNKATFQYKDLFATLDGDNKAVIETAITNSTFIYSGATSNPWEISTSVSVRTERYISGLYDTGSGLTSKPVVNIKLDIYLRNKSNNELTSLYTETKNNIVLEVKQYSFVVIETDDTPADNAHIQQPVYNEPTDTEYQELGTGYQANVRETYSAATTSVTFNTGEISGVTIQSDGEYDILRRVEVTRCNFSADTTNSYTNAYATVSSSANAFTAIKSGENKKLLEMGRNGLQLVVSENMGQDYNFIRMLNDEEGDSPEGVLFECKTGIYGFKISSAGIQYSIDGGTNWTSVIPTS